MQQSHEQLKQNSEIAALVIVSIERTNWSDDPLTWQEKRVIDMAVSAVLHDIRDGKIIVL